LAYSVTGSTLQQNYATHTTCQRCLQK